MASKKGKEKQKPEKKHILDTNKQEKKPTGSLNSRIRGLVRLLKRVSKVLVINSKELPPDVKKQKKLELKELMRQKAKNAKSETERKFAKKYHQVKFFERRKIMRKVEKLEKKISTAPPTEQEALKAQVEELKNDMKYIKVEFSLSVTHCTDKSPEVAKQQEEIKKSILEKIASGEIKETVSEDEESSSEGDVADPQTVGDFNPDLENDSFFIVDKQESKTKADTKQMSKGKRPFEESGNNKKQNSAKKSKKITEE